MEFLNIFKDYNILPSSYYWLLPHITDSKSLDIAAIEGKYPTIVELYPAAFFYAFLLGFLRLILQNIVFKPLAIYILSLKFQDQKPMPKIDKAILDVSFLSRESFKEFCQKESMKISELNRYIWNKKRNEVNRQKVIKFTEALWRGLFYGLFVIIGFNALYVPSTESWVHDTSQHWIGWPFYPVKNIVLLYYQVELGCYIHQLMWTEVSRSDALEMIIHHIVTIALLVFSYVTNFTRIGSSILLIHDIPDIFLEFGKCINYYEKSSIKAGTISSTIMFAFFSVSFFVTRLVIYPRSLVYSLVVEALNHFGMWPGYWVFASLLVSLQCLHVFWFYLILKMIVKILAKGEVEKDVRSDDDDVIGIEFDATCEDLVYGKSRKNSPVKKQN